MEKLYIFADESMSEGDDNVVVVAAILTENPDEVRAAVADKLEEIRKDPELGSTGEFRKQAPVSFHYTADHHEVKNKFLEVISELGFNAHACFSVNGSGGSSQDKGQQIIRLLSALLYPVLQENYHKEISVVYERFDEGSRDFLRLLEKAVRGLQGRTLRETAKEAESVTVVTADKSEPCLAVADYVAGVIKDYLTTKDAPYDKKTNPNKDTYSRNYRKIGGKIRTIRDHSTGTLYSRRNPLV